MSEQGFVDKVKNGFVKFFKGVKNFVVKTGRKNSTNYYGRIENIGDFIVYNDHALISAVGMDDVTFTNENVISYSFAGLGKILMNKATVQYKIVLDDNVVFPELVAQKNDVKNLTATIKVEKDRSHLIGHGDMEYGKGNRGLSPLEACDVYGYEDCFVIALNLERRNGDKVEKYQESVLYPFADIAYIGEEKNGSCIVKFNDDKSLRFTPAGDKAAELIKKLKEGK